MLQNCKKIKIFILWLAVLAAVLVPCLTLFQEGDWFYELLRNPLQHAEWKEILLLAMLLAGLCFIFEKLKTQADEKPEQRGDRTEGEKPDPYGKEESGTKRPEAEKAPQKSFGCSPDKIYLLSLAGVTLTVSYLHSMLLPMLLAGMWFVVLMLTENLIFGIATAIVAAALLSLCGACTPAALFFVTLTVLLLALQFKPQVSAKSVFRCAADSDAHFAAHSAAHAGTYCSAHSGSQHAARPGSPSTDDAGCAGQCPYRKLFTALKQRFTIKITAEHPRLMALITLAVLVQIARANECIDYDSLWYGVRSLNMLAPNGSIFEDLGLVGMVYTYPKGFEILTLPLSGTESYAVISAFNIFLFLAGLAETWKIAALLTGTSPAFAVLLTALVPGIVNMTLSAKPDMITWLLQLYLLERFFGIVRECKACENGKNRRAAAENTGSGGAVPGCRETLENSALIRGKSPAGSDLSYRKFLTTSALRLISVYLLSLTMKPTALIFSTALFGMMFVWTVCRAVRNRRRKKEAASSADRNSAEENGARAAGMPSANGSRPAEETSSANGGITQIKETPGAAEKQVPGMRWAWLETALSALALLVVWGRTMKLTGMPFTSVFTGVLEKLGFRLKYPFTSRSLPQSYQEGSQFVVALKRVCRMLLSPDGKDMKHVIIAWGGSLMFVLGILIALNFALLLYRAYRKRKLRAEIGSAFENSPVTEKCQTAGENPAAKKNSAAEKDPAAERQIAAEANPAAGYAPGNVFFAALLIFLPFIITCFVTLMMLYQVDGNYYMTLYSVVIFLALLTEVQQRDVPFAAESVAEGVAEGRSFCYTVAAKEMSPRCILTAAKEMSPRCILTAAKGTSLCCTTCSKRNVPLLHLLPLALICAFQFMIMTMTSWAGTPGFTKICLNPGYYSHKAYYRELLTQTDGSLYALLSSGHSGIAEDSSADSMASDSVSNDAEYSGGADSSSADSASAASGRSSSGLSAVTPSRKNRVVAFGEHPSCLQFDCIVQSYNDITSPWGNVEIVNSTDAFIDYLHFAKVDYVYCEAAHFADGAWEWSRGLVDEMIARGELYDFVYEGENWVARVR